MLAKIEFDLNDHEDRRAHKRMMCADDMILSLFDISNVLRNHEKYDGDRLTQEKFYAILSEHGVILDDLVH